MKRIYALTIAVLMLSCSDIIDVEDISEQGVMVLAPDESSVLNITDVNFSWETVIDAEQYKLQIATPSFDSAIQIVLDTTIVITNFSKTLELGAYQWRVRAENSNYETAYTTQSFTIE